MIKKLLLVSLLFLNSACTQLGIFVINFPTLFSNQKVVRNLSFGSNYGSKLDLYYPKKSDKPSPVIVFFHGGKWMNGKKQDYRFVADAFTKKGYIVIIPDYVKYPITKFPTWQEDGAKAVVWAYNNVKTYNGDKNNLFVMGHSAGAHIGALLATNNEYLLKQKASRSYIKAFVGIAGPYNFIPDDKDLEAMFAPKENYQNMQVSTYIDGKQPPMLLLWGEKDKDVGKSNLDKLENTLKQKGGKYDIKIYPNIDHIDIITALSPLKQNLAPVLKDIDSFLRARAD
jgi:acetyl esterase/lipase